MNHIHKLLSLSIITLLLASCGAQEDPLAGSNQGILYKTTISGQVQQGNIKDAQVFLDLNDNGVLDPAEPKALTPTDAQGKFTLTLTGEDAAKITPSSKIVSVGGTDTLNPGVKVGLLASELPTLPALSDSSTTKHITPMTTLLAMAPDSDTKGKLKDVLKELGGRDDCLIEGSSQAVIALSKSTEMVLSTLHTSVSIKTGDDKAARDIARNAAKEMARSLSGKTASELRDTDKLSSALSIAAGTAADQTSATSQLDIHTADLVTGIKQGSLDIANAVKGDSATLEITSGKSEVEVMTEDVKGQITTAVNTANDSLQQEITSNIPTTTKSATVNFIAKATSAFTVPIQEITFTSILPVGTTVETDAGSTAISSKALGSGVSGGSKVFGTYSAAGRMVRITFSTSDSTFKGGEFASLVVSFRSPPGLTVGDFSSTLIKAEGYDQKLYSNVDLTGKLQVAFGLTF